jgi:hypothetical protein
LQYKMMKWQFKIFEVAEFGNNSAGNDQADSCCKIYCNSNFSLSISE